MLCERQRNGGRVIELDCGCQYQGERWLFLCGPPTAEQPKALGHAEEVEAVRRAWWNARAELPEG